MTREAQGAAAEAGVFVFARVAAEAVWISAVAVAAWLLAPEQFAYVSFAVMVTLSAVTLGSLGLAESVFTFIGRRPDRGSAIVRQTTLLLGGAAIPVVLLVAAIVFLGRPAIDLRSAFPWIALIVCLELPTQPAVNLLVAFRRARLAAALYVAFALLRGAAILTPILAGASIVWIFPALAASSAARAIAYLAIVRRWFPRDATASSWRDRGELGEIVLFTLPVGFAELCGALNTQIDKYVVSLLFGARDIADYAIGSWEIPIVTTIPYAIGTVLQPRYVRLHVEGKRDELVELWHATVRKTALVVVPFAVVLIVLADDVIATLYSTKYERAALLLRMFASILVLRFAAYGALFRATGRTAPLLRLAGLLVGINLVLSVPFAHLFGFPGPALATLAANWIVWVVTLVALAATLEVPVRRVLPWRSYLATVGLASALGVLVWIARRGAGLSAGASLAVFAPLYLGAFVAAARALGLLGPADLAYAARWLTLRSPRARGEEACR